MRTITEIFTVYNINELESDAQEKALQEFIVDNDAIQMNMDMYVEELTDDLKSFGMTNTIIHYSGFWSQGDGACFTGNFNIKQIEHDKRNNDQYTEIVKRLNILYKKHPTLSAITKRKSNYYCHHKTVYTECFEEQENENQVDIDCFELLSIFDQIMFWIYDSLQKGHEFFTSMENFKKTCSYNDWEFLKNGSWYVE